MSIIITTHRFQPFAGLKLFMGYIQCKWSRSRSIDWSNCESLHSHVIWQDRRYLEREASSAQLRITLYYITLKHFSTLHVLSVCSGSVNILKVIVCELHTDMIYRFNIYGNTQLENDIPNIFTALLTYLLTYSLFINAADARNTFTASCQGRLASVSKNRNDHRYIKRRRQRMGWYRLADAY